MSSSKEFEDKVIEICNDATDGEIGTTVAITIARQVDKATQERVREVLEQLRGNTTNYAGDVSRQAIDAELSKLEGKDD